MQSQNTLIGYFISLLLLCTIGPISIQLPGIPLSLQTFTIAITSLYFGGPGFFAVVTYIGLGLLGLPVWSDFSVKPDILWTPSAGFVLSFLLMGGFLWNIKSQKPRRLTTLFIWVLLAHILLILGALGFNALLDQQSPSLTYMVKYFVPSMVVKSVLSALILHIIYRQKKQTFLP